MKARLSLVAVLLIGLGAATAPADEKKADDSSAELKVLERLLGTWKVESTLRSRLTERPARLIWPLFGRPTRRRA